MNFVQNQRKFQDGSPIHITEEKQLYLIKKKKNNNSVSQNSLYLQCNSSGIQNEDMREKKIDLIF